MEDLNFNLTAMSAPSNRAESLALLDEALHLADEVHEHLTAATSEMERRAGKS